MGHIRLGTLPCSKRWRDVVDLIASNASLETVAKAPARASERDLSRASDDPRFQFITSLLVRLPLMARAPGFEDVLVDLGVAENALGSVTGMLAGLELAIDRQSFESGASSDAGEVAKSALLESLSVQLRDRLPMLFEPTPQEIRAALGAFSSGDRFAVLALDFLARLTYRSLDYYLKRARDILRGRFGLGASRRFEALGIERNPWSNASSAAKIFKAAFANAGLPPFSPHRVRDTITELANDHCRTPEDFKAWSQNMGHDDVLTTVRSYGSIPPVRQLGVIGRFREDGDVFGDIDVVE